MKPRIPKAPSPAAGAGRAVTRRRPVAKTQSKSQSKTQSKTQSKAETATASLKRELREAREQQEATAEVLNLIAASPGDLGAVFQAILERARRLCEARFGILYRYDGACTPAALVNAPARYAAFVKKRGRFLPQRGNALDRALRGKKIVHTVDQAKERVPTPSARLAGARSQIIVPML
jgi:adenylate cyclase